MKDLILLFCLFFLVSFLPAQKPYTGIFHGEDLGETQIHADGIFQFFIESDNLVRRGFPERALLKMDAAIGQHPYFVETYLRRARLLQRLGRYTEAKQDLATAYRLNPYASAFFHKSHKTEKLQWMEFSPSSYQNYIETHPDPQISQLLENSIQKKLDGDLLGALINLETVISRNPEPAANLLGLRANIFLLMEDYQAAVYNYDRAIILEPENPDYYFNRAIAKLFTYDRSAACVDLEVSKQLGHDPSMEKLKYFCYY